MKKINFAFNKILIFFLISFSVHATASSLKISFPVEKFTLENGLTVLFAVDHSVPMISYHTWYRVGSRDEQEGVTGAAHMLEHMMFKGAQKYSGKDFDRILHENGVTNNAFTTAEYTGFYENLPSDKIDLIIDIEVDRMQNLALRAEDLVSELQVVGEERRWRVDNNPLGLLREKIMGLLYQVSSYRWPTIGYMKDIQQYNTEKLRKFYDTYYVPNNAVISVSGDFDPAVLKAKIKERYGVLKSKPLPARQYTHEPDLKKSISEKIESQVSQNTYALSFHAAPAGQEAAFALDLLSTIMGGDLSSRLYQRLVYEKQLCTSVSAMNWTQAGVGTFMIYAEIKSGKSRDLVRSFILQEIDKLKKELISEKELEKARNQTMMDYMSSLLTIDGKAQALAINEIIFNDYGKLFADLEHYNHVSREQIQSAARKYLQIDKSVEVDLIPSKDKQGSHL